jgi:UDP-N-acetylglucosamine:LPS N-acetylglucosamine transferase
LAAELRALKLPFPVHIQDFTDQVASFMWLSNVFIGKPGPGSVSEALAVRLPVIVQDDLRTLAQERYNVQWIREQGVGIPVRRIKSLPEAVDDLLEPSTYRHMARRIEALNNRAVFEFPEVVHRILAEHSAPSHVRFA